MSLKQRISSYFIETALRSAGTQVIEKVLQQADNQKLFAEYYNRTSGNGASYTKQATVLRNKTVDDWIRAMMAATDPLNPRRGELMRLYNSFFSDLHLMSCLDNRILPVQCANYKLVDAAGNESDKTKLAAKLFDRPWYLDAVRLVSMKTFTGTALIEMFTLNAKKELASISEIPQSNFLPQEGIIIKEEYDNKGVSYREGVYANYYFQLGNDYDLGIFSQLAMIVIAKKLGLGSWLNYIDKFGVPSVFIITDRLDGNRTKELHEMMQNFRQNHYTILQGNEKFEIKENSSDAHKIFLSLIDEVANKEISKRILGGTGTTDEKSFVGSTEVHERMLKLRNTVDKLMFRFYMNEEIIPRLIKLSPVYQPLNGLTFQFDDTETMSLKDIIAAVKDLSPYYTFNVEELVKLTELPITEVKAATGQLPPAEPTPEGPQKKKPDAAVNHARITAAAKLDEATSRIINDVYEGNITPQQLDPAYVNAAYSNLSSTSQAAWGDGYATSPTAARLRHNMMRFSGAKAYDLVTKLTEAKASAKTKEDYLVAAKSVAATHNGPWMDAERRFAGGSAASARDFLQFQADKDIYPNLKLRTMADDKVRESHAAMDGMVKKIEDWKIIPPFEPNCRCLLEQTTEETNDIKMNVNQQYANNPAMSGQVFTEKHAYFQRINDNVRGTLSNGTEQAKLSASYIKVSDKLYINEMAQVKELEQNTELANVLISNIKSIDNIKIRPHSEYQGTSNPEFLINGLIADAKYINTNNGVKNGISDANKQNAVVVVFELTGIKKSELDLEVIARKLKGKSTMPEARNMNSYIFVLEQKAVEITAEQAIKGDIIEHLKKLKP